MYFLRRINLVPPLFYRLINWFYFTFLRFNPTVERATWLNGNLTRCAVQYLTGDKLSWWYLPLEEVLNLEVHTVWVSLKVNLHYSFSTYTESNFNRKLKMQPRFNIVTVLAASDRSLIFHSTHLLNINGKTYFKLEHAYSFTQNRFNSEP
jgi:hypothetical protein